MNTTTSTTASAEAVRPALIESVPSSDPTLCSSITFSVIGSAELSAIARLLADSTVKPPSI